MAAPIGTYSAGEDSPMWHSTSLYAQGSVAIDSSAEAAIPGAFETIAWPASPLSSLHDPTGADWDAFVIELLSENDRRSRSTNAQNSGQMTGASLHWNTQFQPSTMTRIDTAPAAWPQRAPAEQRATVDSHPLLTLNDGEATLSRSARYLAELFAGLTETRSNPPVNNDVLRRQKLRFDDDLYTPEWTRGQGSVREGWCTYCSSWWRLKDSAYWVGDAMFPYADKPAELEQYHLQYSHGVSSVTGQRFAPPNALRASQKARDLEALCPSCKLWINTGKGAKSRTKYFRHAYRCQSQKRNGSLSPARTPRKTAEPPRR